MARKEITQLHGVGKSTLDGWIRARRGGGNFSPIVNKKRPGRGITTFRVAAVRRAISMMDQGCTISETAREIKARRSTVRNWRDDPIYREATFEFNPDFNYDPDDLTDRSVVAHALCRVEPNPDERLDMMLAIVGLSRADEPGSSGWVTASAFNRRNRQGAE